MSAENKKQIEPAWHNESLPLHWVWWQLEENRKIAFIRFANKELDYCEASKLANCGWCDIPEITRKEIYNQLWYAVNQNVEMQKSIGKW